MIAGMVVGKAMPNGKTQVSASFGSKLAQWPPECVTSGGNTPSMLIMVGLE